MIETETYMCKNLLINGKDYGNCTLTINKNYKDPTVENETPVLESTNWYIITTCNMFGIIGTTNNDDIECEDIETGKKFNGKGFLFGYTINGKSDLTIT